MPEHVDTVDLYCFVNEVIEARDLLDAIIDGEITRGHCVGGRECYGKRPGERKTTLKDARQIAKTVRVKLNRAMHELDESQQ